MEALLDGVVAFARVELRKIFPAHDFYLVRKTFPDRVYVILRKGTGANSIYVSEYITADLITFLSREALIYVFSSIVRSLRGQCAASLDDNVSVTDEVLEKLSDFIKQRMDKALSTVPDAYKHNMFFTVHVRDINRVIEVVGSYIDGRTYSFIFNPLHHVDATDEVDKNFVDLIQCLQHHDDKQERKE